MGGHITLPGISYYCGSKFALEGISETVSKEVKPFGIAVTAVAPGSFRTDWAGRSMVRAPRSIADYDGLFDPIREARQQRSGSQLGDPAKAARAMLDVIDSDSPPAHLLLGSDAIDLVRQKLSLLAQEIDQWEAITRSTDG
jgi:NAD(P)-dependent dehydrogenase (short-subunit alcohol dehydrogenase family)